MHFNVKEDIIQITSLWQGERFEDGRPRVPDKYLKALHSLTLEEVWKPIFVKGYENQFEGRLKLLHNDGRKLIGRAVTGFLSADQAGLQSNGNGNRQKRRADRNIQPVGD